MKCVILQPSYIPWRGYFHQIQKADVFVFYDDVQYDKHGWRNRNRIKTFQGSKWLTIPVNSRGASSRALPINEVTVGDDGRWAKKHARTIQQSYSDAPFFGEYWRVIQSFIERNPRRLIDLTIPLTMALADQLGITSTEFLRASEIGVGGCKTERILGILNELGAKQYISGPAAKSYLDEDLLAKAGVTVEYMTYEYPPYDQLYPPFDPQVSVLDLLFMTGRDAPRYIWDTPQATSDVA